MANAHAPRSLWFLRWLVPVPLVVGLGLAMIVFASPFRVSGTSMTSTLQSGELVLVDRQAGLQRGEVLVFYPPNGSTESYIKRLIGLPGDHISIRGGLVYVNGERLSEPYLAPGTVTRTDYVDFETTVPAGSIFVLGDDRTGSWDSRGFGPVPIANIVGRAWIALSSASFAVL